MTRRSPAFTLIELLIVVAIIAILAAIAVPNFIEAQTRSKVSRVRADQRSVATAIESYRVDNNDYPPHFIMGCARLPNCYGISANQSLPRLTTPVAYISSLQPTVDIFNENTQTFRGPGLPGAGIQWNTDYMFYWDFSLMNLENIPNPKPDFEAWALRSVGPDASDDAAEWRMYNFAVRGASSEADFLNGTYDPTNGTVSVGDITRFGGEVPPQAQAVMNN